MSLKRRGKGEAETDYNEGTHKMQSNFISMSNVEGRIDEKFMCFNKIKRFLFLF